jgi:hypothetical protein
LSASNCRARSSLDRIKSFAEAEHLECSEPTGDIVYCSAAARSEIRYVRQKWLIRFHLRDAVLERIDVEKGFVGP